jgi:hypothetical protein
MRANASLPESRLFFLGQGCHGNWVVQDRAHRRGGLFANRKEALKFALSENGDRPPAVVMVSGMFDLDITGAAARVVTYPTRRAA